jgi:outer membrane protein
MKTQGVLLLVLASIAPGALAQVAPAGPLNLNQAIEAVIARYPSMDAARSAVDAARARILQANSSRLPQLTGQGDYLYSSLRPYVAISIPNFPSGAIYENVQDSYGVSLTASQLLTDFGRTDKLVDMARSGQIAAEDALEAVRHQLGYQTIQSFYSVILLRSSADVAREEIGALEEALRIAQRKFGAGSATKFDVLTTQVRLANARNHLTDTLASLEKQENGLRQLLGRDPGSPLELVGDFDASASAISESAAIADGLVNRPEMKVARDDEQTAHLRFDVRGPGQSPDPFGPGLRGRWRTASCPTCTTTGAISTRAFRSRCRSSRESGCSASASRPGRRCRSAQARERELGDTITTEVADAYADLNAARARLGNADTLVDQAREALALAQTRYANGVITNFELLDAQSALRAAELSRLQARYDCVLARQAVARAAGVAPQQ